MLFLSFPSPGVTYNIPWGIGWGKKGNVDDPGWGNLVSVWVRRKTLAAQSDAQLLLLLQPGCCCRWLEATATAVARWLSTWQEAKVCNPGKQSRGRRELTVCAFGELRGKWSNKTGWDEIGARENIFVDFIPGRKTSMRWSTSSISSKSTWQTWQGRTSPSPSNDPSIFWLKKSRSN